MSFLNPSSIERFSGFADLYDTYRPRPPAILTDILRELAGAAHPSLVVDLGSGTGLSTRIWAGKASRVIGVEPNPDMLRQAAAATAAPEISYTPAVAHHTGLADAAADIVTASQALHWMAPEATFDEIARILRPAGVFAAFDCDWPPTMGFEIEGAYRAFKHRAAALQHRHSLTSTSHRWTKEKHLARMRESGCFRFTKEITLHSVESGNADRLLGLARSYGGVVILLRHGFTEEQIGLKDLAAAAHRLLGPTPRPWFFSYRVRLGVK